MADRHICVICMSGVVLGVAVKSLVPFSFISIKAVSKQKPEPEPPTAITKVPVSDEVMFQ